MEILKHSLEIFLDSVKLWSLNLIIPLAFSLVSPLLVKDISDIPLMTFNIFRYWLVNGFEMQVALYIWCLVFCAVDR